MALKEEKTEAALPGPRGQHQVKLSWYIPLISVSDRLPE